MNMHSSERCASQIGADTSEEGIDKVSGLSSPSTSFLWHSATVTPDPLFFPPMSDEEAEDGIA